MLTRKKTMPAVRHFYAHGPDRDAVSDAVVKATVAADKQHYSGQPSTTKY